MKIKRQETVYGNSFIVGDQITVKIDGEPFTATAIQRYNFEAMLFIFDRAIATMALFKDGCSEQETYLDSDIWKYLLTISDRFNNKIRKRLYYKHLWLPSKDLVFGEGSIDYFKERKNRICTDKDNDICCWWLCDRTSDEYFAIVHFSGDMIGNSTPDLRYGVRPIFCLREDL